LSLSEVLDAALNTPASEPEAPAKVETQPAKEVAEAPKVETPKTEAKQVTPDSILEKLNSVAVDKIAEPSKAEDKPSTEEKATEEVMPDNASPAAQTAFAKLTRELKEAKGKLKEMESKIASRTEAVENKGGDVENDSQLKELQAKLETLSNEREEMEGELRLSKIEATREFKAVITEPTKAAVQTISEIAKSYEVRPNSLVDAAQEPDGAKRRAILKELTSDMDAVDALQIRTKVEELVQLNSKRDSMVKESKSALEAISRSEQEREVADRARYDQEAKKAFGEVWENFQKNVPILQKVDGNDDWNKTIDSIRTQAEKLDSEPLDHRQRAALTYQAVSLPVLVQVFKDYVAKSSQETTSLRQSLEEYRKATPGAGAGQAVEKSDKLDSSVSFLDAISR
jgi:hypothetical protein